MDITHEVLMTNEGIPTRYGSLVIEKCFGKNEGKNKRNLLSSENGIK